LNLHRKKTYNFVGIHTRESLLSSSTARTAAGTSIAGVATSASPSSLGRNFFDLLSGTVGEVSGVGIVCHCDMIDHFLICFEEKIVDLIFVDD
jgi:hypothetical protein